MGRKVWTILMALALVGVVGTGQAADEGVSISGTVTDQEGKGLGGVMITAFDDQVNKTITIFTRPDGSYEMKGLPAREYELRARLIGLDDEFIDKVEVAEGSASENQNFKLSPAEDLNSQRRAFERTGLLKWDEEADRLNFKMQCMYCHQVGTEGFRTPEEPVDWEVMLSRMDGFRGLYRHTQEVLVEKLVGTFGVGAEENWPEFIPPPAPTGDATDVIIEEWVIGKEDASMIHDLEVGSDGKIYVVDMSNDCIRVLDPVTGERTTYGIPGGKDPASDQTATLGPHSIERAPNGDMWMTLATGGKMAKFDVRTKEFTVVQGGANNRRGAYPHTLRFDNDGILWYTVAGSNGVYRLDPNKKVMIDDVETFDIKRFDLLAADEVTVRGDLRGFARGEGGGITPYGIDIAPDGKVWFTKLNGQRVGVIDPVTEEIVEMKPPVHGPRRLHVAADGKVWVPGFASGDFASYDPKTEEWEVFPLPGDGNEIPYALNIHPTTGDIWICGTGSDSMIRYEPDTGKTTVYRMPSRVTYTREVEFDADGNIWICNSNYPARHIENHFGSIIKLTLPTDKEDSSSGPVS